MGVGEIRGLDFGGTCTTGTPGPPLEASRSVVQVCRRDVTRNWPHRAVARYYEQPSLAIPKSVTPIGPT